MGRAHVREVNGLHKREDGVMEKLSVLLLAGWLFLTSTASAQERIRWDLNASAEIAASNFENHEVKDGVFTGKTKYDLINCAELKSALVAVQSGQEYEAAAFYRSLMVRRAGYGAVTLSRSNRR